MTTTRGLITCLWFDGQAQEAAEHYVGIFKDARLGRIVRTTDAGPGPASVVTVEFELNGQRFMGLNGGPEFTFDEAVSFQILCEDQEEVDYYWERLTAGGAESECGWLKDKYGVSWQVIPQELLEMTADPDREAAGRAVAAMLKMRKLDLAALRAAHAGTAS